MFLGASLRQRKATLLHKVSELVQKNVQLKMLVRFSYYSYYLIVI
jgi:hypothetical protein